MRTLDCEGRRALLTGGTGSSTPVAARAALGAAASGTNSDITGLTGLTSAVPVTGGGTGLTAVATGDLLYGSAANIYTRLSAGTNGQILALSGGVPAWITPSATSSAPFSGLTAAATTNSIDNTNLSQTWNWSSANIQNALSISADALTSGTGLALTSASNALTADLARIEETGNNAAVTGNALKVGLTGAAATGTALNVTNAGTGLAFRVNDDGTYTDASPFVIDAAGNVGIGTASPTAKLTVAGNINTDGDILPTAANTYSLGSALLPWKDLFVSGSTIYLGGTALSNVGNALYFNGSPVGSYSELTNNSTVGLQIAGSNRYLNFGASSGSAGYGIRDNGGTLQFKDSAGAWTSISSLAGSSANSTPASGGAGSNSAVYDVGPVTNKFVYISAYDPGIVGNYLTNLQISYNGGVSWTEITGGNYNTITGSCFMWTQCGAYYDGSNTQRQGAASFYVTSATDVQFRIYNNGTFNGTPAFSGSLNVSVGATDYMTGQTGRPSLYDNPDGDFADFYEAGFNAITSDFGTILFAGD